MSEITSLKELLIEELKDLYSAETQLTKALPKMAKAARNADLKNGFEKHLEETREQINRLEEAMEILDDSPKGKTCKGMQGLIEEGNEAIEESAEDSIRDAKLIGAAQRVEHYEIAAYGTARAFAEALGESEIVDLLQETLDEEGATDKRLTALGKKINKEAAKLEGEEEEEEAPAGTAGRKSRGGTRRRSLV